MLISVEKLDDFIIQGPSFGDTTSDALTVVSFSCVEFHILWWYLRAPKTRSLFPLVHQEFLFCCCQGQDEASTPWLLGGDWPEYQETSLFFDGPENVFVSGICGAENCRLTQHE